MFSGQGSQYYQMGRDLFENDPVFRTCMMRMDAILQAACGESVVAILYDPNRRKSDAFTGILTGPAIFMVEYALAQSLIEGGLRPTHVLGVSLGTYAAAAVAGILTVDDALTAIVGQARVFVTHCPLGGMVAVLANVDESRELCTRHQCEIAAINSASHFIAAGPLPELTRLEHELRAQERVVERLPVSFAFHSRWIDAARASFVDVFTAVRFARASVPLACCAQAGLVAEMSAESFWQVTRAPIRYRDTIERLDQAAPRRYLDLGPSGTLATLLIRDPNLRRESSVQAIMTPFGRDSHNRQLAIAHARTISYR